MTRVEKENLIDRYINGDLTTVEEQEFFILVATDSDLRQALNASRLAHAAIRGQAVHAPDQHPESRSRLLGMLNLPPDSTSEVGDVSRGKLSHRRIRTRCRALDVPMLFLWTLIAVALALAVGTYLIAPILSRRYDHDWRSAIDALGIARAQDLHSQGHCFHNDFVQPITIY
jgi:hypothetical protein